MKPLVYVAGPYSSPNPVANTRRAVQVGHRLILDGNVTPFVPHLSLLADIISPMPYEAWLAYDLDVLEHCDAVLRLSGESAGADREVAAANVPVFEDRLPMYEWVRSEWYR